MLVTFLKLYNNLKLADSNRTKPLEVLFFAEIACLLRLYAGQRCRRSCRISRCRFVEVVVTVVQSGCKRPLVTLQDSLSKKYWVLLFLVHFDVSFPPWPFESVFSVVFCHVWLLSCRIRSSSWFLVCRLSISCSGYLFFYWPPQ